MNEVFTFNGMQVAENINGELAFDAYSVARAVNIGNEKNGVFYANWTRVSKYLNSAKVQNGDKLTEQQMYKLAIKANNEPAEKFQKWVTEEVLPSIRKTGSYSLKPMTATEKLQLTSEAVLELDNRVTQLENNALLSPTDYTTIGAEVSRRIHAYAKLHHIADTGALFKDLNGQIKQVTGAGNRSRIKAKDYDMVIEFISNWEPTTATMTLVKQTSLEV